MPNNEVQERNKVYWYLMIHFDPRGIDKMLKYENEERKSQGAPTFLTLIPFLYLERASETREPDGTKGWDGEAVEDSDVERHNILRDYLHDFVFIKSSKEEIDKILSRDWNRSGRLHLRYYRSHDGSPVRLTDKEMTPFIALFVEQRQKFSFRPYGKDTLQQRTVRIKRGLFKNYSASVVKVNQMADDSFKLTLSIPVFSNEFSLQLYNCTDADIDIPGGELDQVFSPYFVQGMEEELLSILRRQVFRRETPQTRLQDQERLNSYSVFNYLKFDDADRQIHFQSLMLLCATLRRDKSAKDALVRDIEEAIADPLAPATDEEAFATAILFAATKKGVLRKAAKEYTQTHEETQQVLRQLMPLIKGMKTR